MGGLAHFIERGGIATTQISLVRLHSEITQPPRALWVSFELGRPFGPPRDADFQRDVLRAALGLLTRDSGPVLEDYPLDMPGDAAMDTGWACPVSFAAAAEPLTDGEQRRAALAAEFGQLRTWYDRGQQETGRTAFGVSGMTPEALSAFLPELLEQSLPAPPDPALALPDAIRLAIDDVKTFYLEAAAAQPGNPSSRELSHWFWHETRAGDLLREIGTRLTASEDPQLQLVGAVFIVPRAEA